ncbi:MAG TPA: ABC transporter permease [Stellaceae bacterium]|nr:ABC transporter permease [Stellaceae bacterium]
MSRWLPPLVLGLAVLAAWEAAVDLARIPPYIVPAPSRVLEALVADWPILGPSLVFTLKTTVLALLAAVIGGGGLALLFAQSKTLERALLPYAIILQVTPIVAVAPLIIVWVDNRLVALLICAWIVAFFPILANTTVGLGSADRNLADLFRLYGASRWQVLWRLRVPSALPYFFAGLRVSGGLSLVGAVVAEFVAASGGEETGLAYRIFEAGYRLDVPRMFAALVLVSLSGIAIYALLSLVAWLSLRRWHESARSAEE